MPNDEQRRQHITTELRRSGEHRKAGGDYAPMREFVIEADRFCELCDQIDAIHANLERENASLLDDYKRVRKFADEEHDRGFDEGFASADDWLAEHEDAMAEHGWVRLPVDAEGIAIHVGDMLVFNMRAHDKDARVRNVVAVGIDCFVTYDSAVRKYVKCDAKAYVHLKESAVEHTLREFVSKWMDTHTDDIPALLAAYAAKLRLAGDDE